MQKRKEDFMDTKRRFFRGGSILGLEMVLVFVLSSLSGGENFTNPAEWSVTSHREEKMFSMPLSLEDGNIKQVVKDGKTSLEVSYHFRTRLHDALMISKDLEIINERANLNFSVFSDGSENELFLIVADSKGESFYTPLMTLDKNKKEWKKVSFNFRSLKNLPVDTAWPAPYWGEESNGVVDYPIEKISLGVNDRPDEKINKGVIYLADINLAGNEKSSFSLFVDNREPEKKTASYKSPKYPMAELSTEGNSYTINAGGIEIKSAERLDLWGIVGSYEKWIYGKVADKIETIKDTQNKKKIKLTIRFKEPKTGEPIDDWLTEEIAEINKGLPYLIVEVKVINNTKEESCPKGMFYRGGGYVPDVKGEITVPGPRTVKTEKGIWGGMKGEEWYFIKQAEGGKGRGLIMLEGFAERQPQGLDIHFEPSIKKKVKPGEYYKAKFIIFPAKSWEEVDNIYKQVEKLSSERIVFAN